MPRHIIHHPRYLGENLRRLRMRADMPAVRLAEAVGTSKAYISLIESGKRQPHWSTYMKMVHALGESLCSFFTMAESLPPPEDGMLSRRSQLIMVQGSKPDAADDAVPTSDTEAMPFTYILTPFHQGLVTETVEIGLRPHSEWTPEPISFAATVTAIGISGRLLLVQSGTEYILHAGESLHYDAALPHMLRNYTDEPTHAVLVVAPAAF